MYHADRTPIGHFARPWCESGRTLSLEARSLSVGGHESAASERVTGPVGEPLLDIDGLAARLGVTARFVRRLVEERRVPFVKLGRLSASTR